MDAVLAVFDRIYEAKRHEWDGPQFVTLDYVRREVLRAAAEPEAKADEALCKADGCQPGGLGVCINCGRDL